MCSSYNQIESKIILAGDPKQLDAVTKSLNAVKLGYKTSFMEHLFNRRLYTRNTTTGKYNQKFITQLVKNYRSHSDILSVPNNLFYENKLVAKAPKGNLILIFDFKYSQYNFFQRYNGLVYRFEFITIKIISNDF